MRDIWGILGIAVSEDEKEIKRAFRIRSKEIHPEEDPEGFLELKQAYEQAISYAKIRKQFADKNIEVQITQTYDTEIIEDEHKDTIPTLDISKEIEIFQKSSMNYENYEELFSVFNPNDEHIILEMNELVCFKEILSLISKLDDEVKVTWKDQEGYTQVIESYKTRIPNLCVDYCLVFSELLQYARIDIPAEAHARLYGLSDQLLFLIEEYDVMVHELNLGYMLYYDTQYYVDDCRGFYNFAYANYEREKKKKVKDIYYRLIMLFQLIDTNGTIDTIMDIETDLKESRNRRYSFRQFYSYVKLLFRNVEIIRLDERVDEQRPANFNDKYSITQKYFKMYPGFQTELYDTTYFDFQRKIIKDYNIRKLADRDTYHSDVEILFINQWEKWKEAEQGRSEAIIFAEMMEYTENFARTIWKTIHSRSFTRITRKQHPCFMNLLEDYRMRLRSFTMNRSNPYIPSKIMETEMKWLIQQGIRIYYIADRYQKIELFDVSKESYSRLIGVDVIVDSPTLIKITCTAHQFSRHSKTTTDLEKKEQEYFMLRGGEQKVYERGPRTKVKLVKPTTLKGPSTKGILVVLAIILLIAVFAPKSSIRKGPNRIIKGFVLNNPVVKKQEYLNIQFDKIEEAKEKQAAEERRAYNIKKAQEARADRELISTEERQEILYNDLQSLKKERGSVDMSAYFDAMDHWGSNNMDSCKTKHLLEDYLTYSCPRGWNNSASTDRQIRDYLGIEDMMSYERFQLHGRRVNYLYDFLYPFLVYESRDGSYSNIQPKLAEELGLSEEIFLSFSPNGRDTPEYRVLQFLKEYMFRVEKENE